MANQPTLAELNSEALSLLNEIQTLVRIVAHGDGTKEKFHHEYAASWLRRVEELDRRYTENAIRHGWASVQPSEENPRTNA